MDIQKIKKQLMQERIFRVGIVITVFIIWLCVLWRI